MLASSACQIHIAGHVSTHTAAVARYILQEKGLWQFARHAALISPLFKGQIFFQIVFPSKGCLHITLSAERGGGVRNDDASVILIQ